MDELKNEYKKTGSIHHALFVVAKKEEAREKILKFLAEVVGLEISGNPDLRILTFDTVTIADARLIDSAAEMKPTTESGRKFFIIETNAITEEAQNSLLKLFEEPVPETHFFLVMPQNNILPTLRSRMTRLSLFTKAAIVNKEDESLFTMAAIVNKGVGERMAFVKYLAEKISDEEKSKQDAIDFVNQIESELRSLGVEKNAKILLACENAREALFDRGAPIKMILENLMLII